MKSIAAEVPNLRPSAVSAKIPVVFLNAAPVIESNDAAALVNAVTPIVFSASTESLFSNHAPIPT